MTRHGKIARLPHPIREQINRRLQNGAANKQTAEWLNTLPEVRSLLEAEFDGQPINEVNLSNWKLGGYRDWEAQQEVLKAVRRFCADAAEINQATGGELADHLALCMTARIAVALQQPAAEGEDAAAQMQKLRDLCGDLVALRKGDQNAQWLRIEREKMELQLKKSGAEADARQRAIEALKNPTANCVTKECIEWFEKEFNLF